MESASPAFAQRLFARIAPEYEQMGALFSLGQEARWRRFLVSRVSVGRRARVLDVASGTGLVARELVRATGASVVSLDHSAEMLAAGARANRAAKMEGAIEQVLASADALPFPDASFDAVTFTYLLRYVPDPSATLRELSRVLRPGGTLASLEFYVPQDPVMRCGWRAFTRIGLPMLGATASPQWRDTGRFLGPNIEEFHRRHPLRRQAEAWMAAGLVGLGARTFTFGAAAVTWGTRQR
ncbi:MAG: class I SAM-dependent methyltransferase [Thermoleophilia bacterium]|nr:class I SAM-dependent methyltransferase [Thermoleophilia bacterium]